MKILLLHPNHLNVRQTRLQVGRDKDVVGVEIAVEERVVVEIRQSARDVDQNVDLEEKRKRRVRLRVENQVGQRAGTRLHDEGQGLLLVENAPEDLEVSEKESHHGKQRGVTQRPPLVHALQPVVARVARDHVVLVPLDRHVAVLPGAQEHVGIDAVRLE